MRILVLAIFILTIWQQKYRANAYPIRRKPQNRPVLNWNSKPFRKFSLSWALVAYLILKTKTCFSEAILHHQKVVERKESRINRWHRIRLGLLQKFG